MPWPFRRRRTDVETTSAPVAAPLAPQDLAGPRRLTPHPGSWQTLEPLKPAVTGAAAPVVSSSASFIADLAGTHSLLAGGSLREVSPEAPRGVSYGLARPLPPEPAALITTEPAPTELVTAEAFAVPEVARRPVVASGTLPRPDLTAYVGELMPAEPDVPDDAVFFEPALPDDELPEELPPPIFTSLLAERTGRALTDLRPDLADTDLRPDLADADLRPDLADTDQLDAVEEPTPQEEWSPPLSHRHSLAESRRLGLGAPLPSGPFDVGNRERLEEPQAPEPTAPAQAPPPAAPAPPPVSMPEPARRAAAHYRSAEVPPTVRTDVTRALGRDPGAVRVRRDEEASSVAARIGARAFTRAGEIFLPVEAGPLDAPETRAVLAHELTHVVQHRVYGSSLPRTSSADGQRLEAEAHAVERFVRGDDPVPRVAPVRTLRATPGDPKIDSGGFIRAVTEQLVASGAAQWDDQGSLLFRPPQGADEEWRAPTATSKNIGLQIAMEDDQRATTAYGSTRGASTTPDDDRRENDRHLEFVHGWRDALEAEGGAMAADAGAALDYELRRGATPDAQTERQEFERHLQLVNDQGGVDDQPQINIVSGGIGTALGLGWSLFDSYDEIAEEHATHHAADERSAAFAWNPRSSGPSSGASRTSTPSTSGASGAGASAAAGTPSSTPSAGSSAPAARSFGSSEGRWEADDEKPILSGGLGVALAGIGSGLFDSYDEDLSKDSHWGQHWVEPKAPATTTAASAAAATLATPGQAGAAAAGAEGHGPQHELGAAGSRARERSISGTDPTDIVAHLDDQDLEDLATMLFQRLQTRLRQDLIVGRERSGFLTDFR